jgi:WD40 repeat protein
LWNVETGKAVRKLTGHHGPVYSLAAAPHRLASSSQDHTIRIWSLESGRCVRVLHGHTGAVFGVSVWQDWLASCSTDSTVRVWNLHSGQCIRTLSVSRLAHGVTYYCVDILEGLVVSGCFEEVVNGWDVASGRLIFTLGQQSADKKAPFLEIGEASVSEVKIIGKTVVFSSWHENYNIHILDYHTRESIRQLRGHSRRVRCLRVHPNTFTMITGGDDGTIKIWKLY